ncbi:MAG: response regulator [Deltaproteobacteria bacterium]|nr:response regulator [Deltaproteobacteria bacterium]
MKIMIVDDSPISRRSIRMELESGGYEVIEASSGEEALYMLEKASPDLVTMDVSMPGINGFETSRRIFNSLNGKLGSKRRFGKVPVVVITQVDNATARLEGFKSGVTDFLTKPFQQGKLRELVDYWLKPCKATMG